MTLSVLDLFAGLRGWSQPFIDREHRTLTIEWDKKFPGIDVYADILTLTPDAIMDKWQARFGDRPRFDIILASPPCTAFTTMTMGRNWEYGYQTIPRTETAAMGARLVRHTRSLIDGLAPRSFIIENPRARLRTLDLTEGLDRRTVWYCRYGERRAKPTDLWGGFPDAWTPRAPCRNGFPDHDAAPRGSTSGTQGTASAIAAKIPYALAEEICIAVERAP